MNHHHQRHDRGRGRRDMPRQFGRGGWRRPAHNVPVNIVDHGDHFTAHVYAVGFAKADIEVVVSGDTLYIAGRRTPADDAPDFLLQEFPIKHFERSFELSEVADKSRITAAVDEAGVLVITVPKVASATQPDVRVTVE